MDAFAISSGFRNTRGIPGLLISLAVVFGGSATFAAGVTELGGMRDAVTSGIADNFSETDLAQLDHATSAGATASRLAAMGEDIVVLRTANRSEVSSQPDDVDLFPVSGRVMPLLVTRPGASPAVARVPLSARPGLVQPVGVSRASLRSRTPSEQAAR